MFGIKPRSFANKGNNNKKIILNSETGEFEFNQEVNQRSVQPPSEEGNIMDSVRKWRQEMKNSSKRKINYKDNYSVQLKKSKDNETVKQFPHKNKDVLNLLTRKFGNPESVPFNNEESVTKIYNGNAQTVNIKEKEKLSLPRLIPIQNLVPKKNAVVEDIDTQLKEFASNKQDASVAVRQRSLWTNKVNNKLPKSRISKQLYCNDQHGVLPAQNRNIFKLNAQDNNSTVSSNIPVDYLANEQTISGINQSRQVINQCKPLINQGYQGQYRQPLKTLLIEPSTSTSMEAIQSQCQFVINPTNIPMTNSQQQSGQFTLSISVMDNSFGLNQCYPSQPFTTQQNQQTGNQILSALTNQNYQTMNQSSNVQMNNQILYMNPATMNFPQIASTVETPAPLVSQSFPIINQALVNQTQNLDAQETVAMKPIIPSVNNLNQSFESVHQYPHFVINPVSGVITTVNSGYINQEPLIVSPYSSIENGPQTANIGFQQTAQVQQMQQPHQLHSDESVIRFVLKQSDGTLKIISVPKTDISLCLNPNNNSNKDSCAGVNQPNEEDCIKSKDVIRFLLNQNDGSQNIVDISRDELLRQMNPDSNSEKPLQVTSAGLLLQKSVPNLNRKQMHQPNPDFNSFDGTNQSGGSIVVSIDKESNEIQNIESVSEKDMSSKMYTDDNLKIVNSLQDDQLILTDKQSNETHTRLVMNETSGSQSTVNDCNKKLFHLIPANPIPNCSNEPVLEPGMTVMPIISEVISLAVSKTKNISKKNTQKQNMESKDDADRFVTVLNLGRNKAVKVADFILGRDPTCISILCIDRTQVIWLLADYHIAVTDAEFVIEEPTYWTMSPDDKFARILLGNESPLSKSEIVEPAKPKLKVREFAKCVNDNLCVPDKTDCTSVSDATTSLTAPQRVCMQNKIWQKLWDNPVIYGQVYTVVQSLYGCREISRAGKSLFVYSLKTGKLCQVYSEGALTKEASTYMHLENSVYCRAIKELISRITSLDNKVTTHLHSAKDIKITTHVKISPKESNRETIPSVPLKNAGIDVIIGDKQDAPGASNTGVAETPATGNVQTIETIDLVSSSDEDCNISKQYVRIVKK